MAARNHEKEKQDLYSTTLAQRFDPETKQWEDLPSLPAPRSSHDAVVKDGKLYVVGGWQLTGGTNKPVWPANALVLDLAHPEIGWKEFPQPFQRRALAAAATGSRLYCIGGMDSNNKTTLAVEVYDLTTGKWSKGPDLPPGPNKGFSCSAIALNGRVYANAFQGDLLRLSSDGNSWEVVGRVQQPRLAHRLVTAGKTQLIVLGGEDGDAKRPELELLTPAAKPLPAATVSTNQTAAHAH
jgi:N-acetylneuraminic acid mutarotase